MPDQPPAFSIIIPTFNGARRLPSCLEALKAQKSDRPFQILVIDDGSNNDAAGAAGQYEGVHVIRQRNSGPAAARNRGVAEARGEIVLFIDDDCIAESGWLQKMTAPFVDPQIAGAKGAYLTRQAEWIAKFVQVEYEEKYEILARSPCIDLIDTYSAAFRRKVYLDAGGYDTRFPVASAEDREFSCRLARAGHKLIFIPEARVWHTHVSTVWGYMRKKFKNGYWNVLTMIKNPNMITGTSDTPWTQKAQLLLTAGFLPSCAALAFWPWGVLMPLAVSAAFVVTAFPLTFRCFSRYRTVGLAAPFFITCRAIGLTTGLTKGVWDWKTITKR